MAAPYAANASLVQLSNISYTVPKEQEEQMCSGPKLPDSGLWTRAAGEEGAQPQWQGGLSYGSGRICPAGLLCVPFANPHDGFTSFDNMLWTFLTVFQVLLGRCWRWLWFWFWWWFWWWWFWWWWWWWRCCCCTGLLQAALPGSAERSGLVCEPPGPGLRPERPPRPAPAPPAPQITTQEGWTDIMYYMQDAVNTWTWIYFVGLVVLGAMFVIQLAIAVLCVHYDKAEEQVDDEELREKVEAEEAERQAAEKAGTGGKAGASARSSATDDLDAAGDQFQAGAGAGAGADVESGGGGLVALVAHQSLAVAHHGLAVAQHGLSAVQHGLHASTDGAVGVWQWLHARCHAIQAATWFEWLSVAMVIANTLLLSLWWSNMPAAM